MEDENDFYPGEEDNTSVTKDSVEEELTSIIFTLNFRRFQYPNFGQSPLKKF